MSPLMTPVGRAGGVAHDRALDEVGRIGRACLDPEGLEPAAVQEDLVVRLLKCHGIVRSDAIELLARKRLRIVGELRRRPAADVEDPLPRSHGLRPGLEHLDRLLARFDAVKTQLQLPRRAGAKQVHVIVDKAGNDRPAAQIDSPGVRSGHLTDGLVRADRDDAIAFDGDRLRDGEALVDGDDLAVRENQVCLIGLRARERNRTDKQDTNTSKPQRLLLYVLIASLPYTLIASLVGRVLSDPASDQNVSRKPSCAVRFSPDVRCPNCGLLSCGRDRPVRRVEHVEHLGDRRRSTRGQAAESAVGAAGPPACARAA